MDDPLPGEPDEFADEEDDYPGEPEGFASGPGDFASRPGDFASGPRTYTGRHGNFPGSRGDFTNGHGGFAAGPDDFATGPRDFATGHDEFATGHDEFAGGADDFESEAPSIHGSAALDYLDGSYTPPARPAPSSGQPNGFAVAAFVLGAIGGTILSAVLAIIALRQIRDTGQRGRGLAIGGLAFSVFWALVLAWYLFLFNPGPPANQPASVGSSSPSSSSTSPGTPPPSAGASGSPGGGSGSNSGGVTHPQTANVFALSAGECFQNPPSSQTVLGITSVTAVPCTTPHNAQVFAEFAATGTSYPGTPAIKRQADQGCHARLAGRVVNSKVTSTMTLRFLYPLASSWSTGHRTISCIIVDAKPDLKGSLLRTH